MKLTWLIRPVVVALGLVVTTLIAVLVVLRGPAVWSVPQSLSRRPVSPQRLEADVRHLVEKLTPRWYQPPAHLDRAADWVRARMEATGLAVREVRSRLPEGDYRNLVACRPGTDPAAGTILVGAHYDAYGDMPGADDNASGVAVLLELMRTLPREPGRHGVLFAAFANEEPPFFSSREMGSHDVVMDLARRGDRVELMIALDLVGYFSDEPGSQQLPLPWLAPFFPSTGNFIAIVGDLGSGEPIARVKRGMRATARIPVVSFRGPRWIPGIDWSDHYWFREHGIPAVLVTDTAMMRNPHYHRSSDLPETLDYRRMAEVVQGLHGVLALPVARKATAAID